MLMKKGLKQLPAMSISPTGTLEERILDLIRDAEGKRERLDQRTDVERANAARGAREGGRRF